MKLLDDWRADLLKNWTADIVTASSERQAIVDEHGRQAFIRNRNGISTRWAEKNSWCKHLVNSVCQETQTLTETATDEVKKMVERHYKTLQMKVEKKIGKILEIEFLGGSDYKFIGENDWCYIEVIGAGGYNIQRWHTRWIIKKTS